MQRPSLDPRAAPRGLNRLGRPRQPEVFPVRLDRKRLYIVPTSFGLGIGMLLVATVISALNNGNNPAMLLAVGSAAMIGIALIQTHQRLVGVRVLSVHAMAAFAGDEVVVRTTLDHRRRRVKHGLRLAMGQQEVAFDLAGEEPTSVDMRLHALPRGVHPMGRLRVATVQPMNVAMAWAWVWPRQSFLIYPLPESNPPAPGGRGGEDGLSRAARQGHQVHHLRAWRVGDSLRDIAWKASARQDRLMSREYEAHGRQMRRLDWEQVAHLPTEQALSRLAAWVIQADSEGCQSELTLPHAHVGPGQGLTHRHACLTALALVPADVPA